MKKSQSNTIAGRYFYKNNFEIDQTSPFEGRFSFGLVLAVVGSGHALIFGYVDGKLDQTRLVSLEWLEGAAICKNIPTLVHAILEMEEFDGRRVLAAVGMLEGSDFDDYFIRRRPGFLGEYAAAKLEGFSDRAAALAAAAKVRKRSESVAEQAEATK